MDTTTSDDAAQASNAPEIERLTIGQVFKPRERANKRYGIDHETEKPKRIDDYKIGQFVAWTDGTVRDIRDFYPKLRNLQKNPKAFAIRGRPSDAIMQKPLGYNAKTGQQGRVGNRRTLRLNPGDGDIVDAPRRLHSFDIDGVTLPAGIDVISTPEAAVRWFVANHLPPEFRDVTLVVQWSNSAALTAPTSMFKAHVWWWSDRPYSTPQIWAWGKWWNRTHGTVVDTMIYTEVAVPRVTMPPARFADR